MPEPAEDSVLRSARREALVVFVTWVCALAYTVTYCSLNGFNRSADELQFVLGFPDWVFWGIVTPWSACFVVSWWFSYVFVSDEDLGEELEESEDLFGGDAGDPDSARPTGPEEERHG